MWPIAHRFSNGGEITLDLCSDHELDIFRLPAEEVVVIPDLFIIASFANSVDEAV